MVAEDPELPVDVEVDDDGWMSSGQKRVDDDAAGVELLADGAVGQDHAGGP